MRHGVGLAVALLVLFPFRAGAEAEVEARFYGVQDSDSDGPGVSVAGVCEARAARVIAATWVTCSIDDATSGSGISSSCWSPGPEALCPIVLRDGVLPAEVCADAVAVLPDGRTYTDTWCRTFHAPTS